MYAKISSVGFPENLDQIELKAILRASPPTWEDAKSEGLVRAEFDRLLQAWNAFEGPVKDVNHFMVCVEIASDTYATVTFDHGSTKIEILFEEEIDRDLIKQVPFSGQRIAEKRINPNSKCACGSGRKAKKCCLRKR